jgi:hypothetical protein
LRPYVGITAVITIDLHEAKTPAKPAFRDGNSGVWRGRGNIGRRS